MARSRFELLSIPARNGALPWIHCNPFYITEPNSPTRTRTEVECSKDTHDCRYTIGLTDTKGIAPPIGGLKARCLTTWRRVQRSQRDLNSRGNGLQNHRNNQALLYDQLNRSQRIRTVIAGFWRPVCFHLHQ